MPAKPGSKRRRAAAGAELSEQEEAPEQGAESQDDELAELTDETLRGLLVEHRGEVAFVQAIELEIRARLRLLDLGRRRKELMEVATAERLWFQRCREIRDKILQLPPTIRDGVLGVEDPHQVELIIEQRLVEVLSELASGEAPPTGDEHGRN
jgi:hypothetical protein